MKNELKLSLESVLRCTAALMLLLVLCLGAVCSVSGENTPWLEASPVCEGDRTAAFRADPSMKDLQISILSGEENLAESAERTGETLTVKLNRSLKAGEVLTVTAEGTDSAGETLDCHLTLQVAGLFQSRLITLQDRLDDLWPVWKNWRDMLEQGKVYLPKLLNRIPFMTWPDEAPSLAVSEEVDRTLFRFSESVPEGWRVCTGAGLPVEYTDCVWDEAAGAWIAESAFDGVYLIHDMTEEHFGLSIEYPAETGWLPAYPVLEWNAEEESGVWALGCYGWGNARSFSGAMLALVEPGGQWYAEYDKDGVLTAWYALHLDCQFDSDDNLVSGTLPEGFVSPVIH